VPRKVSHDLLWEAAERRATKNTCQRKGKAIKKYQGKFAGLYFEKHTTDKHTAKKHPEKLKWESETYIK
jgi:hypothetical protein